MTVRKAIGGTLITLGLCPLCIDLGATEAPIGQLVLAVLAGAALIAAGALIGGVYYDDE